MLFLRELSFRQNLNLAHLISRSRVFVAHLSLKEALGFFGILAMSSQKNVTSFPMMRAHLVQYLGAPKGEKCSAAFIIGNDVTFSEMTSPLQARSSARTRSAPSTRSSTRPCRAR